MSLFQAASLHTKDQREGVEGGGGNEESGVTGTGLSRPKEDWGCSAVGGVLTSICKVLGSVLSTLEKQAQQRLPAFSRLVRQGLMFKVIFALNQVSG